MAAWGSGGARLREGGGDALRRLEGGSEIIVVFVVGVGFVLGFIGKAGGSAKVEAEAVALTVAGGGWTGGWTGGGSRGLRGEDLSVVPLGRLGRLLGVLWIPVGSVVTTGSGMPSWVGVGGSSGSGSGSSSV